jgi:hypothetical protein
MNERTFRLVYDQDPFVTEGRAPWKYEPPVIGSYSRVTRIFAACAVTIFLLSVLGALVFYRNGIAALPETASSGARGPGIMQRLRELAGGGAMTIPPILVLNWLNHVRHDRSYYRHERPAEYFLLQLVLWTAGSIIYFLTILSVPAAAFGRAMAVQVLWLLPWVIQFFARILLERKDYIYYGPGSTFRAIQDSESGTASLCVFLMILMLILVWITRFISWLL